MAENLGKWPSKRGPISKIRPSEGCGRDGVPLAVDQWYDFHEFGCHRGKCRMKGFDQPRGISVAVKAIDIEAELATLPVLHGRSPETPADKAAEAFATLAAFRDGSVFAGSFEGESAWERHTRAAQDG